MSAIDSDFIDARITQTKAMIVAYEDAILAVGTNGIQEYTLDTGQTRQSVTKADLAQLRLVLRELEERLARWSARKCGTGVRIIPAY